MSSYKKKEKKKIRRERNRLSKLQVKPGDILLYRVDASNAHNAGKTIERIAKETQASLVIAMEHGDTLESMSQQLFEEAMASHIGERAAKVIRNYADRARSRAS